MSKTKQTKSKKTAKAETNKAAAKTKAAATAAEASAKKPKGKKAAGEPKPKRVGALDAAAQVLQKAGKPMRCTELVASMAEQGLWTSPAGKTPQATLYSAILREIRDKKGEARFTKTDRGQFAFNK